MQIPRNTFKALLREPHVQIGLWLGLADSYSAEICAGAGFHWLMLDGEHAPNDLRTLLAQLQAMAPYGAHAVVRPPVGASHLIKQLLDIGAQTLLIPMVESADQAAELVRAMRYPPNGIRGVGSALARASRFNTIPDYLQQADEQMCLLVQIESKKGLDNLHTIAQVEGVDGVFIGPSDLCAALGHLGNPSHPDVQSVIEQAISDIQSYGKACGILTQDSALARHYIELGCRFVAVGTDVTLLSRGAQQLARSFSHTSEAEIKPGAGY